MQWYWFQPWYKLCTLFYILCFPSCWLTLRCPKLQKKCWTQILFQHECHLTFDVDTIGEEKSPSKIASIYYYAYKLMPLFLHDGLAVGCSNFSIWTSSNFSIWTSVISCYLQFDFHPHVKEFGSVYLSSIKCFLKEGFAVVQSLWSSIGI